MWLEWLYLLVLAIPLKAVPDEDRIFQLPDLKFTPNFKQYSGYLTVESGNQLFYWLTSSPNQSAPLVLWLNGGPGCSSMAGLMSEFGPFQVKQGGLVHNKYAWNEFAHILYLDAPAGVGFSILKSSNWTTSDEVVAKENKQAMTKFFQKFPELKKNRLFLAGESYGGTYIPMLGDLVLKDKPTFPNFEGILIGNGCVHEKLRINSQIPFNFYHGLIAEKDIEIALNRCCKRKSLDTCDWHHITKQGSEECKEIVARLDESNFYSGLDPYLLDYACYPDDTEGPAASEFKNTAFSHRRVLSKNITLKNCHHENEYVPYLNRKDVQSAIHVNQVFSSCSRSIAENYIVQYEDMTPFIRRLIDGKKRILMFNGDMDSVCTHVHNLKFIDQLGEEFIQRSTWKLENRVPKTAGVWTSFNGIDLVTVNGGGHFVSSPYEKPREALQIFVNFIQNSNYSTTV
ncbi:unnamed protein product [Bursaphelenchus xylophilus]|uniref:Carboxypeptidase n=1 Tax=Bursaphelenchus xylophilus TaxID=6326 RepID=A0A1I7RR11_BURXY|nr:unnamed protein product [Bursaphelenchus xylophilus]CAG9130792.1 unnamed protein product [Bursaphelenchus xylophilus]